jgi:signal peptidase I
MKVRGLAIVAVLTGMVAAIRATILVVTVSGESMAPTLRHDDRVLVLRRKFTRRGLRDAMIVTRPPDGVTPGTSVEFDGTIVPAPEFMVKRVAAVGGETGPDGVAVPFGRLYLLGDSEHSVDSRHFGPIQEDHVIGVVLRRLGAGGGPNELRG